jgi:hypothetical protein
MLISTWVTPWVQSHSVSLTAFLAIGRDLIIHVLLLRPWFQVRRVDAARVMAAMQDQQRRLW